MIFIYSEDFIYLGFYRLNVILIVDCKDMKRPLFKLKSPFKPKFFVFKPKLLTLLISSILSSSAFAGQVYSGVDYQYFRDFAENKGKFTPGAQNIAVVNKKGESIGTMMQNAPMMDFSVVSRNGVAALVGDQYIVSVAHNVGYRNVDFGMEGSNPDQHRFGYNIVKRNNYKNDRTHPYMTDYHNPRLAKFVTEAAPIEMVSNMQGSTYGDLEKYPMRVRIGSGWQFLRDDNDNGNHIAMAYNYLTAGNTFMQGWANNGEVSLSGDVRHPNQYGPLPISGSSGDSGSPMFIYDKTAGKWLINGVLRSGHPYQGKENTYQIARKNYLDEIIAGDLLTVFDFTAASYDWTADDNGSGKLTKGGRVVTNTPLANYSLPSSGRDEFFGYGGPNPYMPALHHGKNIYFGNMENGTVTLKNNIDQGAGGLTFEGDFVVQPTTDETWKGAGVSVSEGSTVTWKVKNPAGDRLSKIGQGTLLVNGKGENLGDISVGDGVVVLNQQADEQGKKQAFNQLGIVSGRPTVKLESADQVDPNNIYFGFRGGRLDLNGHSLTFNRIQNTDEGAQIVNHNKDTAATITIRGNAQINNEKNINQSKATAFNGWFGETNATLHNGRLNIDYQPTHTDSVFLLSGGTNLNGNVTQTNGTLVFSGRPTPHAYNHQNRPALIGRPQGEVVIDDDWLSRTFKAEKYIINGGSAVVSRNVSAINGDWQLSNSANATLGVTDKQANFICARSDWTGLTKCASQTLSDKVFASIERSKINGNFTLNDNAKLSVLGLADVTGNVALQGQSQYRLAHNATQTGTLALKNQTVATVENATLAGDATLSDQAKLNFVNARFDHQIQGSKDTLVSLSDNANWTLPSSTTIGNLSLNNSQITLNPDFATQTNNQTFNQLTVLGDLSGNGTFNYRTYLQENKGDHVAVHGLATGNFVLNVRNTGAEPQTLQQLSLLTLKNTAQIDNVNVALANGTVDVGTYRYELKNDNHDYRLYNPRKEQELADQARLAEEKRKAEEAARLAKEKRKAEELARLAEEKRKADEAARLAEEARIAEAKAKAEELRLAEEQQKEELRLAEEKRKTEELARLAEEKRKADETAARLIKEQALLTTQHQSLQPKQKDLISRYANSALSELSSSLNGSLLIQNELNKHMFEQNSSYIWYNTAEFSGRYHSDDFRDYQQKTHLNQLGLQHIQDNYRAGLLLSYARTKNEFDDDIHGKSRLNMVSAFTQSQFENGINMILDASRGIHFSKIFGKTQDADIRRHITSLGVGFDYQFDLDKLSIQPNFSTHHYQFSGTSYVYDQVQVHTPKNQFNVYQAGATLKYTFTPRDNLTITPQVSIHYLDVSNAKFTTQVNQAMLNQSLDSRWQKEIGLQASFGGWSFSAYAAQTQSKQQEKQHQAGLKVGVYW